MQSGFMRFSAALLAIKSHNVLQSFIESEFLAKIEAMYGASAGVGDRDSTKLKTRCLSVRGYVRVGVVIWCSPFKSYCFQQ